MTSTNVTCFNFSDGAIDLTVSGGTSPYDYMWTNGANSEDLGSLSEGNYSVTITDNNGCVLLDSLTITQPTEITQQNGFSDVGCFGESTEISLTILVEAHLLTIIFGTMVSQRTITTILVQELIV